MLFQGDDLGTRYDAHLQTWNKYRVDDVEQDDYEELVFQAIEVRAKLRKAPKPASKRRTLRLRPDPGNNRNDPSKRRTLRLRPDPGNNRNDPSKQRTLLHPDPSKLRALNPAGGEEEGPSQADARESNLSPEVRTNQFGSEDDDEHPRGSLSHRRLEAEVVRLS